MLIDKKVADQSEVKVGDQITIKSIQGNNEPSKMKRRGISHVPERRELFASMTVQENLELGAYNRRRRENRPEVERDLRLMGEIFPILGARRRQLAGTLSGGEQQMLALARGLMSRPRLLLLDEPSLGLAPLMVQEVLRVVRLLREMGRTVLLVEQNAQGALQVADRAYLMETGRVVMQGTAQELLRIPGVQRAYLGQRLTPPAAMHKAQFRMRKEEGARKSSQRAMHKEEFTRTGPQLRILH